jgi:hypothetical protein
MKPRVCNSRLGGPDASFFGGANEQKLIGSALKQEGLDEVGVFSDQNTFLHQGQSVKDAVGGRIPLRKFTCVDGVDAFGFQSLSKANW